MVANLTHNPYAYCRNPRCGSGHLGAAIDADVGIVPGSCGDAMNTALDIITVLTNYACFTLALVALSLLTLCVGVNTLRFVRSALKKAELSIPLPAGPLARCGGRNRVCLTTRRKLLPI